MSALIKAHVDALWQHLLVAITFSPKVSINSAKVTFLGRATLRVTLPSLPGFGLTLTKVDVVILNGKLHLDFPTGKPYVKDGKTVHPPIYCPSTAEMRAVLSQRMMLHAGVIAAIAEAKQLKVQSQSVPAGIDFTNLSVEDETHQTNVPTGLFEGGPALEIGAAGTISAGAEVEVPAPAAPIGGITVEQVAAHCAAAGITDPNLVANTMRELGIVPPGSDDDVPY